MQSDNPSNDVMLLLLQTEGENNNGILYSGKARDNTLLTITQTELQIGSRKHPIQSIKYLSEPTRSGLGLGKLIGGIVACIIGLALVINSWFITGLIIILVAGINIWMAFDREYFMTIFFDNNGNNDYKLIAMKEEGDIVKFYFPLATVVISVARTDESSQYDKDQLEKLIKATALSGL